MRIQKTTEHIDTNTHVNIQLVKRTFSVAKL